jgi:DNA-binding NarL/FixJ family response regulator
LRLDERLARPDFFFFFFARHCTAFMGVPLPIKFPGRSMPKVIVVDDHAVIRRGVQVILHAFPEWELCGEAENGQEAIRLAETLKPEIIIMDVSMPGLNGLEATRIIHNILPDTKILLLTLHSSRELVRSAFRAGARGYVLKSDAEHELVRALNVLAGDGTYVSPGIDQNLAMKAILEESHPPN